MDFGIVILFLGGMLALIMLAVEVVHSYLRGDTYWRMSLGALLVFAVIMAFFGHYIQHL